MTPAAVADGLENPWEFEPTATHTSVEEHVIELSACMPPLTVLCCQVWPALSLVRMVAPTAMQRVAFGQVTAPSPGVFEGAEASDQVFPPSLETSTSPL